MTVGKLCEFWILTKFADKSPVDREMDRLCLDYNPEPEDGEEFTHVVEYKAYAEALKTNTDDCISLDLHEHRTEWAEFEIAELKKTQSEMATELVALRKRLSFAVSCARSGEEFTDEELQEIV